MSQSAFKVQKAYIVIACNNAIKQIKDKRKDFYEKEVEKAMNAWWHPTWSREKAEKYIKCSHQMLPSWEYHAWGTLCQAEDLLAACHVSGDQFPSLTVEDAAFVYKYTSNEEENEHV